MSVGRLVQTFIRRAGLNPNKQRVREPRARTGTLEAQTKDRDENRYIQSTDRVRLRYILLQTTDVHIHGTFFF